MSKNCKKEKHTLNQANKQAPVALVTGAARRIGAAIARHLQQKGFRVVIHYHHSFDEACAVAHDLNQRQANSALTLAADLTLKAATTQLISNTINWAGQLDLLVNNASIFKKTRADTLDEADWDTLFTTNVKAPFWLSHAAYPHLKLQGGSIVNITDIHAEHPLKDYAVYCQTKAALTMQTKALAREFAPHVRINAIAPGAIAWPEQDNALSDATRQQIIAKTPLRQHGNPLFIAQAVLGMAENPFITGQTLNVDGGRSLGW